MKRRDVSPERKATYYLGMIITAVGIILFLSCFVTFIGFFGERIHPVDMKSGFGRAFVGMLLAAAGQLIMRIGHSGLAGSGVILDAEDARRDLEPWSRMGGGRIQDALDEAGIDLRGSKNDDEMPFDEKLRRLEGLRRDGLISEEEFAELRTKILEQIDEQ